MSASWTWEQVREIRTADKAREDVERYDKIMALLLGDIGLSRPIGDGSRAVDRVDDALCTVLLPEGDCDCGDYAASDPNGVFRDRSHLTVTDCCEVYRFLCETGTVLDGAGDPDVTACKAGMGCDA